MKNRRARQSLTLPKISLRSIIKKEDAGASLLEFLSKQYPQFSKRRLKTAIEQNGCTVNGRIERFASVLLAEGDEVAFSLPENRATVKEIPVLFEDAYFIIYDKPPGIPSEKLSSLFPVHRLDKQTSGAILFAKTKEAKERAELLFRERKIKKTYYAIADGIFKEEEGTIENYLAKKGEFAGQSIWGAFGKSRGAYAKTVWKKVKEGKKETFIHCYPHTGRTHQIRVHFSEMGHPLLGDGQYGKQFRSQLHPFRVMLHAAMLEFEHPFTHEEVVASAPLPDDFQEILNQL